MFWQRLDDCPRLGITVATGERFEGQDFVAAMEVLKVVLNAEPQAFAGTAKCYALPPRRGFTDLQDPLQAALTTDNAELVV